MKLKKGQWVAKKQVVTQTDSFGFATIVKDYNLIHINREYAATTRFKKTIVHGAHIIGIISGIIATEFPGPGTIIKSIKTQFLKPIFVEMDFSVILYAKDVRKDNNESLVIAACVPYLGDNYEIKSGYDMDQIITSKNTMVVGKFLLSVPKDKK